MLARASAENGFLAVFKPGQGAGGNAHSGQKHGLWRQVDLATCWDNLFLEMGPQATQVPSRGISLQVCKTGMMVASLFKNCRELK